MTIFPIPNSRVSDRLLQQRMLAQLQSGQQQLLRIQQQLATGRRLAVPSDDAPAAIRAIGLQRLIEQKLQIRSNVSSTKAYLNATDNALSTFSKLIIDVRGVAVTAADSTKSELERLAAAEQVRGALQTLVDVGNEKFRGRFLFSGSSTSTRPLSHVGPYVSYAGNNQQVRSFGDLDFLIASNVAGQDVFGAVSSEVRGNVDLNPTLTSETRLSDLNQGLGVHRGSFRISDGNVSSVIDISSAETVGDVVRLIEDNPPAGRDIDVRITATGLQIEIDPDGGGNLLVKEIDGGRTALELGILNANGVGSGPLVGLDLNPALRLTNKLDDLFGVRASTIVRSDGLNNNLIVTAKQRGAEFNDIAFHFVDDDLLQAASGLSAGNELAVYSDTAVAARASLALNGPNDDLILTAKAAGIDFNNVSIEVIANNLGGDAANTSYDPTNRIFRIEIDNADRTTLQTVVNAINASPQFAVAADNSAGEGFDSLATVAASNAGSTTGDTGNSGGNARTIFVNVEAGVSTASQALAAIQSNASITDLVDVTLDPKDTLSEATQGSGAVDAAATGLTSGGAGVEFDLSSGLQVTTADSTVTINLQGSVTVEDLLNRINGAGGHLLAEINDDRDGINVRSRLSGADFAIAENGGQTAEHLGLRTFTRETRLDDLNHGRGVDRVVGTDLLIRRNDGVELSIDLSTAQTVGDVIDLINTHPDNLDPATAVTARLRVTGNGLELVDDNPSGTQTLTVIRPTISQAAWDLGLIAVGQAQAISADGPPPTPATATVTFQQPNHLNNGLVLTASRVGTALNGVQVNFINSAAVGDTALVNFDPLAKTLTIDVDPAATTANTVIAAIGAEGTFTAGLETTLDPNNNGTGLIVETGTLAVTAGGSPSPTALPAIAELAFPVPNDKNTALRLTANQAGTAFNGVEIEFRDTLAGDLANVTYDAVAGKLFVDIDSTQTRAATILSAVTLEGTFNAELDLTADPTNDGSGVVGTVGVIATADGGTAEVFSPKDVNPHETKGIFNTLIRLQRALTDNDLPEIERIVAMLDDDQERLNFGRAALGARGQGLDVLEQRLANEEVELESTLSNEIDVDMAEAITRLSSRQAAFQATLASMARNFQLTLLDFI